MRVVVPFEVDQWDGRFVRYEAVVALWIEGSADAYLDIA